MSREQKRELNVHLHRKHGGVSMADQPRNLVNRLEAHEAMHRDTVCDHEHEDYSEPGSYRDLVKDA